MLDQGQMPGRLQMPLVLTKQRSKVLHTYLLGKALFCMHTRARIPLKGYEGPSNARMLNML